MKTQSNNSKQHGSRKAQRGYTLMEMMVVLALLAVAAALVVPTLGRGYGNFELRLAASSVSSAFKQARMHAVYEERSYIVLFGPERDRRRDVYVLRDDGKAVDHMTLIGNFHLLAEQEPNVWSDQLQPIHFFPDGHSEALQLDIGSSNGRHLQLVLNPLTAHAQVTKLYNLGEKPVSSAPEEPTANITVLSGDHR